MTSTESAAPIEHGVGNEGDRFDEIIGRAQARIGPLPIFRHFQKFEVGAGLIALDGDLQPIRRFLDAEVFALPGESPVGAVRPGDGGGLFRQKSIVREIDVQSLRKELLGPVHRLGAFQAGAGRGLFENVVVADNPALGIHARTNFLFLTGTEETHLPIPDADVRGHEAIGLLEADLALEVGLRIVVHIEDHGGLIALQGETLGRREVAGAVQRGASRNLEIDRGFGKSAEEVAISDKSADERGQEPKQKDAQVTPAENVRSGFLHDV